MEFLGERIRNLRETIEFKQKDIAEKFLVSENTWSQYENNKRTPDLKMLKKIAEFFNVSLDYLLYNTDELYNPKEEEFQEIAHIYCSLDKKTRRELIAYLKEKYKIERR